MTGINDLIGSGLEPVRKLVRRYAPGDATVLITGESGVGKELIAQAIHAESERRKGPFEAVNCAQLSKNLAESELFGHVKGAFTGANRNKDGWFQQANGGTLFLDEIGDLQLELQAKLLRVVQEKVVRRLGADADEPIDVRIVAATNQNLEQRVRATEFRDDLFYRLNVLRIPVPPLRERREDVPALIHHFRNRHDLSCSFSDEALDDLRRWSWPGNVRQLESLVQRLARLADDSTVTGQHVSAELLNEEGEFISLEHSGIPGDSGDAQSDPILGRAHSIIGALDVLLLAGDVHQAAQNVRLWSQSDELGLEERRNSHLKFCQKILKETSHDERPIDFVDSDPSILVCSLAEALAQGWGQEPRSSSETDDPIKSTAALLQRAARAGAVSTSIVDKGLCAMMICELEYRKAWPTGADWKKRRDSLLRVAGKSGWRQRTELDPLLTRARDDVHGTEHPNRSAAESYVTKQPLALPSNALDPAHWMWKRVDGVHVGVDAEAVAVAAQHAWSRGTVSYNGRRVVIDRFPTDGAADVHWSFTRYMSCGDAEGIRIGTSVLLQVGDDLIIQYRDPVRGLVAPDKLSNTASGAFALEPNRPLPLHEHALHELRRELWADLCDDPGELEFLGAFPNAKRRVIEVAFYLQRDSAVLPALGEHYKERFKDQEERFESYGGQNLPAYFRLPVGLFKENGMDAVKHLSTVRRSDLLLVDPDVNVAKNAPELLSSKEMAPTLRGTMELWLRRFA